MNKKKPRTKIKTIHSPEYAIFMRLLRQTRERQEVTQEELAERWGVTQSFVSKCERGERRIDIVELRAFCKAMDIALPVFVAELDRHLTNPPT